MSLLCHETGRDMIFGDPLYAGGRRSGGHYCAIGGEILGRIPESERRANPCEGGDLGVNIYAATSSRNWNGSYAWIHFRCEGFLFSVSRETAERYLPKTVAFLDASS